MSNVPSFSQFVQQVTDIVGDAGLNVLINMAGMACHKGTLAEVEVEDYVSTYMTNLVGPVFLTKALLPLVKKAAALNSDKPHGMNRAAILNISSLLGSVSLNDIGNYISYRESKAALNTFTRTLRVELDGSGILVLPIHPGWVQTDLGGPNAHLTVEESVSGMCRLIYELDESKNGQFLQWDGKVVPW